MAYRKQSLMNAIALAAVGTATSWLVRRWLDARYERRVTHAKRELKEDAGRDPEW